MKHIMRSTDSLYKKMLMLLLFAMGISAAFYFSATYLGNYIVDHYYSSTDYEGRMTRRYVNSLQAYVDDHGVKATDQEALEKWTDQNQIISLWVIRDNKILYDSVSGVTSTSDDSIESYAEEELDDEGVPIVEASSNEYTYTLTFADGTADVYLFGAYSYNAYVIVRIIILTATFLFFIGIILAGVRRAIRYVRTMRNEVEILEGGDLSYQVTVKGNDELADLARAVNSMREALNTQFKEEENLYASSSRMLAEMSHDLRTPLTSIILYTDLLQKKSFADEEQMWDYIFRINKKAHQMKTLTDHLFEYTLIGGVEEEIPLATHPFQDVFYDSLSDLALYLTSRGFHVDAHVEWNRQDVVVYDEYIPRLLDNVVSNIEKYAPKESTIQIATDSSGKNFTGLSFENAIRQGDFHADSSHVGLMNIRKMMDVMHGTCRIEKNGESFKITLYFRNA